MGPPDLTSPYAYRFRAAELQHLSQTSGRQSATPVEMQRQWNTPELLLVPAFNHGGQFNSEGAKDVFCKEVLRRVLLRLVRERLHFGCPDECLRIADGRLPRQRRRPGTRPDPNAPVTGVRFPAVEPRFASRDF
jgi:hypothetical protein